jgi:hypothetical protein
MKTAAAGGIALRNGVIFCGRGLVDTVRSCCRKLVMLMERESTEGGRGREEILVLGQRELGKSDWPGPLLCALFLFLYSLGAQCSFFLRRPLGPLL